MKYIARICLTCQKSFRAEERYVKRGHAKYCSRLCFGKRPQTSKLVNNVVCAYCDKPFYKNKSKQKISKSGLFFCCRTHKDLAQRIGGIQEIMPPHYGIGAGGGRYRKTAFENLPHKCSRCGYNKMTEVLQVHHKDRNRQNNLLENLEIICPTCHNEDHYLNKDGLYNNLS